VEANVDVGERVEMLAVNFLVQFLKREFTKKRDLSRSESNLRPIWNQSREQSELIDNTH
jgi:hypothetical protein